MTWDWASLRNRRRPVGVSSLPTDNDGVELDEEGSGSKASEEAKQARRERAEQRRAAREARRQQSEAREGSGRRLTDLAQDPGAHEASGAGTGSGAATDPAEAQVSAAMVAQAEALRSAAESGTPFCDE